MHVRVYLGLVNHPGSPLNFQLHPQYHILANLNKSPKVLSLKTFVFLFFSTNCGIVSCGSHAPRRP